MIKFVKAAATLFPAFVMLAAAQPPVHVDSDIPTSPRPLEKPTQQAVVRDYLESWESLQNAFEQNRADLLNADFVGGARESLSNAIKEQSALGLRTHYEDLSHNLQIVFYSPEGLSIELIDTVKYSVQVFDRGRLVGERRQSARYLVVMSPSQLRWRVRVFQGGQG